MGSLMYLTSSDKHRVLSKAHRETVDGLLVLHLAGSPYEMGFQHGALCKAEIYGFRREAYAYMSRLIASALKLPQFLARPLTRPLLMRQVRAYLPFTTREHLNEMQGIADGAGVHILEALLVNAVWEMYLVGGCSEFALRGSKTADGELLHGYNYDLADPAHAFINPYLALIFSRPADGYAFAQVNTVGCVGVNAGLSAKGISVAWDNTYLRPESTLLKGIPLRCTPMELALRHLVQSADSVKAGVAIMRSHLPRPTADIIIVGDGQANQALALEMAGDTSAIREMSDDAVWSANSFVSPALGPEDRRGMPGDDLDETGSRLGRYASYTELITLAGGKIDVHGAVQILRDPYPREKAGYIYPSNRSRTICRPVTSFSLVMQPKAQRIWVGDPRIPAPQGRYLGFDLQTEAPLTESPIPSSGFHQAVQSVEHFTAGRYSQALQALEKALTLDGESIPLRLMSAQVHAALGNTKAAQAEIDLARASGASPGARIPFPSAIQPLITLTA
jgi:hypothetical protein